MYPTPEWIELPNYFMLDASKTQFVLPSFYFVHICGTYRFKKAKVNLKVKNRSYFCECLPMLTSNWPRELLVASW